MIRFWQSRLWRVKCSWTGSCHETKADFPPRCHRRIPLLRMYHNAFLRINAILIWKEAFFLMVEKQREAVWRSWFRLTPRRLCMMGVLLAMQVVMSRLFNVQLSDSLRVNLGFLPNAVAGMLMGPFCGMLVAACADLLGATLFPSGAVFPGFTLTAALAGMNYGLWLYRRKDSLWRAALCILPVTLVCNIALNTLWLWMLQGSGVLATFPVRAVKNLAQYPVNVALLYLTMKLIRRMPTSLTQV